MQAPQPSDGAPPPFHIYSWQNIKYALPIISSLLHHSLILIGFCKLKCQRMETLGSHNDGLVDYSIFFFYVRGEGMAKVLDLVSKGGLASRLPAVGVEICNNKVCHTHDMRSEKYNFH